MLTRDCMQGYTFGGFEMSEPEVSKAARTLSKLSASKGGGISARKMTPEQRKARAQKGADARWGVPRATHGSPDRPLRIGNIEIECYVLADGTRVLSQAG